MANPISMFLQDTKNHYRGYVRDFVTIPAWRETSETFNLYNIYM